MLVCSGVGRSMMALELVSRLSRGQSSVRSVWKNVTYRLFFFVDSFPVEVK